MADVNGVRSGVRMTRLDSPTLDLALQFLFKLGSYKTEQPSSRSIDYYQPLPWMDGQTIDPNVPLQPSLLLEAVSTLFARIVS